jgi:hypothetical protein
LEGYGEINDDDDDGGGDDEEGLFSSALWVEELLASPSMEVNNAWVIPASHVCVCWKVLH